MFHVEHFETKTREGTAGFYPPVPSRVFAAAKGGAKTKTVAHLMKYAKIPDGRFELLPL